MANLYCNKKSQALHKGGEVIFVRKNPVVDLLSVKVTTGLVEPRKV